MSNTNNPLYFWIPLGILCLILIAGAAYFIILANRDRDGFRPDEENGDSNDAESGDDLVLVRGGEFLMGSDRAAEPDVKPACRISVSSFYLAKTELTQRDWKAIMEFNPSQRKGSDLPVTNVSWFQALEYCNRRSKEEGLEPCYSLDGDTSPSQWSEGQVNCDWKANGFRLPTEAEWEYAARGGREDMPGDFSGSSDHTLVAWTDGNTDGKYGFAQPVGELQANELGLYDLSGNVWEWCWDWYGSYSPDEASNPRGPAAGRQRCKRGGSYYHNSSLCKVYFRSYLEPAGKVYNIGFRVCRSNV